MTTLASALVTRVRTNVNEPTGQPDPLRSDSEIIQWLQDGVNDYMSKLPVDAFPSMVGVATFSAGTCSFPSDYLKTIEVIVNHTLSGTYTEIARAFALSADEGWLANNWGLVGCWTQIRSGALAIGPSAISGTLSYIKAPAALATTSSTFGLPTQHEEPVVNYATAMALGKVNDTDAERYMTSYNARIAAERARYGVPPFQEPK